MLRNLGTIENVDLIHKKCRKCRIKSTLILWTVCKTSVNNTSHFRLLIKSRKKCVNELLNFNYWFPFGILFAFNFSNISFLFHLK